MNTIIGKILKFIVIVLVLLFVIGIIVGKQKEEPKNEIKTESVKIEEKETEIIPYVILKDKISSDVHEIEIEYSKKASDKYTETAKHLLEKYDHPKEIGYYEYPLELVTDILREDVIKNKNIDVLTILIKEEGIKVPLMHVTIVKNEYVPLGNDINNLTGILFWRDYQKYGDEIGLSIGMQPDTRKLYEQLFD